jgi:hypothetical protein
MGSENKVLKLWSECCTGKCRVCGCCFRSYMEPSHSATSRMSGTKTCCVALYTGMRYLGAQSLHATSISLHVLNSIKYSTNICKWLWRWGWDLTPSEMQRWLETSTCMDPEILCNYSSWKTQTDFVTENNVGTDTWNTWKKRAILLYHSSFAWSRISESHTEHSGCVIILFCT